ALASSANLARLAHLSLANNEIGHKGVRALVSSPRLASFRSLGLDGTGLDADQLEDLLVVTALPALTELDLGGNDFWGTRVPGPWRPGRAWPRSPPSISRTRAWTMAAWRPWPPPPGWPTSPRSGWATTPSASRACGPWPSPPTSGPC